MSAEPDDLDSLAAEYVLGVLTAAETEAVSRELARNADLAAAVSRWENRLSPLAAALPPVPVPDSLWPRLEASIAAHANVRPAAGMLRSMLGRARLWQLTTAALAACVVFLLFRAPPTAPRYAAALTQADGPAATWLVETRPDGALVVTPLAPASQPDGTDLELWGLAAGAGRPVSLGVLPASRVTIVPAPGLPRAGLKLLVSVEPHGGSPTGQPTGPVLYAGLLQTAGAR